MTTAFHLETRDRGLASLTFDLPGKKVNVLTREVMGEFETVLTELEARTDIAALVLFSAKPENFIAGADIGEIAAVTDPEVVAGGVRFGQTLFGRWQDLPFATAVAVRGSCVGGGTELALASDRIWISDRSDIRIGLPEVRIGIIPAWGGCTRLPRRIGVAAALDIILAGKTIDPQWAFELGLADALLPDATFQSLVWRLAEDLVRTRSNGGHRRRGLKARLLEESFVGRSLIFKQARKRLLKKTGGHYPAPLKAIEVVEIGVTRGPAAGFDAEARATAELAVGPVCKHLMHVFALMEAARTAVPAAEARPIRQAAVLGAGNMGGDIARLIADRCTIPVRLKDMTPQALAKGLAHAAAQFERLVRRGRIDRIAARTRMNLLRPTLDYTGLGRADVIVEAIVENLQTKQEVLAEIAERVPDTTILASNTSSLSIDRIADAVRAPTRVVGMHFFNPVARMPLVEVVRGPRTDRQTVATVVDFARHLGKTPIVVADGPGFLVNRLLGFYMAEALWLLAEGCRVEDIDQAMIGFGMPVGPLALIDQVGTQVALRVAHNLAAAFGDRLELPPWCDRLSETECLGAESSSGIYLYSDGQRRRPDPALYDRLELPVPTARLDSRRLVDRLLLPMVNEAARCLDESIVDSPGDLDLAMILGTGFPPFRGGLCRWADQQGLAELVQILDQLVDAAGSRYRASPALGRLAQAGGFYGDGGGR